MSNLESTKEKFINKLEVYGFKGAKLESSKEMNVSFDLKRIKKYIAENNNKFLF